MHYEINVSKDGYHFFATSERSIASEASFKIVLKVIKEKFPKSEGYSVSASLVRTTGQILNVDKILEGGE